MGRPRKSGNRPPADVVTRIATEEGERLGVELGDVLGSRFTRAASAARRAAWVRILRETKCSMSGLADVWGCHRQAIWRHSKLFAVNPQITRVEDISRTFMGDDALVLCDA